MDELIERQFREQVEGLREGAKTAMKDTEVEQKTADQAMERKQRLIAKANNWLAMAAVIEAKILNCSQD